MAEQNARIFELPGLAALPQGGLVPVWDPIQGLTGAFDLSTLLPPSDSFPWVSNNVPGYQEGELVTYGGKIWESLVDDNLGNVPMDGSAFWVEQSKAPSGLKIWQAGIYLETEVYVLKDIAGILQMFQLEESEARPFNSSDFDEEYANGNWKLLSDRSHRVIEKADHGFTVGKWLTIKAGNWELCDLEDTGHARVVTVVNDDFAILQFKAQIITNLAGLTPFDTYYHDDDGDVTDTDTGNPAFVAISATEAIAFSGGGGAGGPVPLADVLTEGNDAGAQQIKNLAPATDDDDADTLGQRNAAIQAAVEDLLDGVDAPGNTLKKLYDLIVGLGQLVGPWNTAALPTTGTGAGGAIDKGDYWRITGTITIAGIGDLKAGDMLVADKNNAAVAADFFALQNNVDVATSAVFGIVKLYTNLLASNTDGSVTQAALVTALALLAPLASPALTGNPTTPTQAAGDNTTKIATTAFVRTAKKTRLESIAHTSVVDLDDNLRSTHNIVGAIAYTKGVAAHIVGNIREDFLTANGANKPTFSADFVVVWDNWVNTNGTLNVARFEYLSNGKIQVDLRNV